MIKKIGFIVNPMAGIGGSVGLKGSDGKAAMEEAIKSGAVPESPTRAVQALKRIYSIEDCVKIITYPYEMGEYEALKCGFKPTVIGSIIRGATTGTDTQNAARDMAAHGVDLILFAGGDGTAKNIFDIVNDSIPVLGIPSGVKMHSAVFAASPVKAGDLACLYLTGSVRRLFEAEVMDIDEEVFREGRVSAKLYGHMKIPYEESLVQCLKCGSSKGEGEALKDIACHVIDNMMDDYVYVIGPGTTTRAITDELELKKTLLGVDVLYNKKLWAMDVNENKLLELIKGKKAKIIVTPIGGQGYIFGRGNQQISSKVIKQVGKENIIIIATKRKITSLSGRPLLVDTHCHKTDKMIAGYFRVITGYNEQLIYKCEY